MDGWNDLGKSIYRPLFLVIEDGDVDVKVPKQGRDGVYLRYRSFANDFEGKCMREMKHTSSREELCINGVFLRNFWFVSV